MVVKQLERRRSSDEWGRRQARGMMEVDDRGHEGSDSGDDCRCYCGWVSMMVVDAGWGSDFNFFFFSYHY